MRGWSDEQAKGAADGGVAQTKQPPANPGRFKASNLFYAPQNLRKGIKLKELTRMQAGKDGDGDLEPKRRIDCAKVRALLSMLGMTAARAAAKSGALGRSSMARWAGSEGDRSYNATSSYVMAFMRWAQGELKKKSCLDLPLDYIDFLEAPGPLQDPARLLTIERPHKIDLRTMTDPFSSPIEEWKEGQLVISLLPLTVMVSPHAPSPFILKEANVQLPGVHPRETYRWLYQVALSDGVPGWLGWVDNVRQIAIEPGSFYQHEILFRASVSPTTLWQDFLSRVPYLQNGRLDVDLECLFDSHTLGKTRLHARFVIPVAEIESLHSMCRHMPLGLPRFMQPKTLGEPSR